MSGNKDENRNDFEAITLWDSPELGASNQEQEGRSLFDDMVSSYLFEQVQRQLGSDRCELLSLFKMHDNHYWGEVILSAYHRVYFLEAEIIGEKLIAVYLTSEEEVVA